MLVWQLQSERQVDDRFPLNVAGARQDCTTGLAKNLQPNAFKYHVEPWLVPGACCLASLPLPSKLQGFQL